MSTSRQSPAPAGAQGSAPGRNRGSVPAQWRLAPQGPQARPSRGPVDELKERIAPTGGPERPSRPAQALRVTCPGPRLGRRWAAGLTMACVLALGVAACSLKDVRAEAGASTSASASAAVARAEQGIADANASATASREAALTPELRAQRDAALAEPAPAKPAHMDEESARGATGSVYYFLDLYRYAFMTGNTAELAAMSDDQCKFCQSTINDADDAHKKGGWANKWDQEIVSATYYEKLEGYDYNRIKVVINYGATISCPEAGAQPQSSEPINGQILNFGVRYSGGHWRVGAVDVEAQ